MTEAVVMQSAAVRLGRHWAMTEVDFTLPEGAVLAVLGPNGSGKSTLVRALLGVVPLNRGSARVLGLPPADVPAEWIAYVPQIKMLDRSFPGRSIDLVATGMLRRWPWRLADAEHRGVLAGLEAAGAAHLAERTLGELSGGELQRVYLARAVARRPRLVLLDEPATGMDPTGEESVHRYVDECRRTGATTVVLVTHDLSVAYDHATHALLLSQRQIAFGTPPDVLARPRLQEAFGHHGHALSGSTPWLIQRGGDADA